MFITALFTTAKTGNNLNVYPQMKGFRRCGEYTQWNTTQPLKMNKILSFAATWVELETLIVIKVSQKEKDKYHMAHLYLESNIWHKLTDLQKK